MTGDMGRNLKSRRLVQLWYRPGEPMEAKDTNMASNSSADTSDQMFSLLPKGVEVVEYNRSNLSVNLLGLPPEEWDTAKWRFEGWLHKRDGAYYSEGLGQLPVRPSRG